MWMSTNFKRVWTLFLVENNANMKDLKCRKQNYTNNTAKEQQLQTYMFVCRKYAHEC